MIPFSSPPTKQMGIEWKTFHPETPSLRLSTDQYFLSICFV
jgi:hypothetical protein